MKNKMICFILTLSFAIAIPANPIPKMVKELFESIVKKGGVQASRELAEFGGERGLARVLEKATREGGKDLAQKVFYIGRKHGLQAIRIIEKSPALYTRALQSLPKNLVERGIWALQRDPAVLNQLLSKHGPEALSIASKHRGIGVGIVNKLGDDGIRAARNLSESQAATLAKNADTIASLSIDKRNEVIAKIVSVPGKAISFLEKNPKTLRTAAGLAAFLVLKEDLFGKYLEKKDKDGNTTYDKKEGFFDRALDKYRTPFSLFILVPVFFLIMFFSVKFYYWLRKEKKKAAYTPPLLPLQPEKGNSQEVEDEK